MRIPAAVIAALASSRELAASTMPGRRAALATAARLPGLVDGARSLDEANDALHAAGIRTELDYERENAGR